MISLSLKHLVVGLAMIASTGLSLALTPHTKLADKEPKLDLEKIIPGQFGDWKQDQTIAQLVSPDLKAALDKVYTQTLTRTYLNTKGDYIMLSMAYGANQSDDVQVHLPEGCYRGQGFAVGDKKVGLLHSLFGNLKVARLEASKDARYEPITYWVVVGDTVTTNNWEMKKAKLRYALKGEIADGLLIRISSIDTDTAHAYDIQQNFANAMLRAMTPDQRSRLIGTDSR